MENRQLAGLVRTLQVVGGALIFGLASFALVTLLIVDWGKLNVELSQLGLIVLIASITSAVLAFILPGVIAKQAATQYASANPKPELNSLLHASGQAVSVRSIIGFALAEGGAFMALLVWMISGNVLGLIGAFLCLAVLILKFPTTGKIEQQMADFREEVKLQQRGR